jgi:hypothetical protein
MPHTAHILHGRYAVVSCHVERALDDECWRRFSELQERRPGGFAIARGPFGLHTHWTAPDHARPTEGTDPAGLVREQGSWLRSVGLESTLFCGGGWYFDERVADAVADLGYADCTATAFRPAYLADDAPHLQLEEPTWFELAGGRRLLELPTTQSIGMLARGIFARSSAQQVVHAYFHDTDLLDRRRSVALRVGLAVLGRRRTPSDLGELQRGLRPEKTMSFANKRA